MPEADSQSVLLEREKSEKVFMLIRKHWISYLVFVFVYLLIMLPILASIIYLIVSPAALTSDFIKIMLVSMTILTMLVISVLRQNQIVFITLLLLVAAPIGVITAYVLINPDLDINIQIQSVIASLSIFSLTVLGMQLYAFVNYYLNVYIITDQRLVDISQESFFNRKISELHLHQIQDVNAQVKGVIATFLHFGDVDVQTAGEREDFIFATIPNPYTVAKEILNLHQAHIESSETQAVMQISKISQKNNVEPDRGLTLEELEAQAKKLLKQTPFMKRLKNQGLVQAAALSHVTKKADLSLKEMVDNSLTKKPIESTDQTIYEDVKNVSQPESQPESQNESPIELKTSAKNIQNAEKVDKSVTEQGELTEGKEVDLK
jgi:hypothetical protein